MQRQRQSFQEYFYSSSEVLIISSKINRQSQHIIQKKDEQNNKKQKIKEHKIKKVKNEVKETEMAKERRKGRPISDQIQKQHQQISRTYSPMLLPYYRTLLFLQNMKNNAPNCHVLTLTAEQNTWLSIPQHLMYIDVFPQYTNRSILFLQPANSLHFILEESKKISQKVSYEVQELKFIFFGFLIKRGLLSTEAHKYISQYWERIVSKCKRRVLELRAQEKSSKKYVQKIQKGADGTIDSLNSQFSKNPAILAVQIAEYLAHCFLKYDLKFLKSKTP